MTELKKVSVGRPLKTGTFEELRAQLKEGETLGALVLLSGGVDIISFASPEEMKEAGSKGTVVGYHAYDKPKLCRIPQ